MLYKQQIHTRPANLLFFIYILAYLYKLSKLSELLLHLFMLYYVTRHVRRYILTALLQIFMRSFKI